jgi:hypothetical protein
MEIVGKAGNCVFGFWLIALAMTPEVDSDGPAPPTKLFKLRRKIGAIVHDPVDEQERRLSRPRLVVIQPDPLTD